MKTWSAVTAAFVACIAGAAISPSAQAESASGWRVSLTPYLWVAGTQGTAGGRPGSPPVDVNASFKDTFSHLQGAFIGMGDVGYGRFGLIADVIYLKIGGGGTIRLANVVNINAEAAISTTSGTVAGYYRVYDSTDGTVDLLGGMRFNSIGFEADLSRVNGAGLGGKVSKSWTDPVVGVRVNARLGGRSSLTGYVDVGLGGSSEKLWQAFASYNYDISDGTTASLGYRYSSTEYRDGSFVYDIDLGGPFLAVTFRL